MPEQRAVERLPAITMYPELAQARVWNDELDDVLGRLGRRFFRSEPRETAKTYLRGLLAPVERKNGWQLAEQAGCETPYRLQHLLNRVEWDADEVRDDLRDYVVERLGEPEAVLALDETGFVKKGVESAGVQRQYSGTAGRIENCQLGVFMAYVSPKGRALVDRALYMPHKWVDDPARREKAGVPPTLEFKTKPLLAREMVERAHEAGVPFRWVTADEAYGQSPTFRDWLMAEGIPFVVAVCSTQRVCRKGQESVEARAVAKRLWGKTWKRMSAGAGTNGERLYDWALVKLRLPPTPAFGAWLLVRRSIDDPKDLAYYLVCAPQGTTFEAIVKVAGSRWAIEECFEAAKGEVGLDNYEVRKYDAWYRHVTIAMFAHAYLAAMRAAVPEAAAAKGGPPSKPKMDSLCDFKRKRGLSCP